jgi:serine/threonine protein kinase
MACTLGPMAVLTLEIVEGSDAGRSVALAGDVVIGRDAAADLTLSDKLVSRRHARVHTDVDGAVIEDLGSSNGTFVNDVEIAEPTRLEVGDKLLIGESVMHLRRAMEESIVSPPLNRAAEDLIGSQLAGYRIEAIVARGGMGVVYRAEHVRLGRKVALKLLPPDLAVNEGFRERFEGESRLAAAIDHPNIIPLYDAGKADGLLYLTMRFVDGSDLRALLEREGPLQLERAISIVGQIGGALDAAHARGLVHRDVKPGNILVASGTGPEDSDHCYLTDFGLTRDTASTQRLTAAGEFVGTIDYAAPEQIQGDSHGGAADQYSLGCVFYECLVGHPPFTHATELDVMWAHINDPAAPVSEARSDLPKGIDAVLARAMAKIPEDRFETCAAMTAAARATIEGGRWRTRRSR